MSKKTVFFLKEAMVEGTGYSPGDTLEVDKKKLDRLKELGLGKEFDDKTDGVKVSSDAEIAELTEALEAKDTEIAELKTGDVGQLKKEISTLKGQLTKAQNALAEATKVK